MQIYYVLCNVRLFQGLKNIIVFTVVLKKYRCCQSSVVSVSLFQFIYIWNIKFLSLFSYKMFTKNREWFSRNSLWPDFFLWSKSVLWILLDCNYSLQMSFLMNTNSATLDSPTLDSATLDLYHEKVDNVNDC